MYARTSWRSPPTDCSSTSVFLCTCAASCERLTVRRCCVGAVSSTGRKHGQVGTSGGQAVRRAGPCRTAKGIVAAWGFVCGVPAQDCAWGDQAMTAQDCGQSSDEGGEHGPVRQVQARRRVGSAEDGDLVTQHEQLDVLDADVRPSSNDHPRSWMKIRYEDQI